jgi:glycosyltransferase involved in cell wall biosynthesis
MDVLFVTFVDITGESGQNIYSREISAALARHPDVDLTLVCPDPSSPLPEPLDRITTSEFISSKEERSPIWQAQAQLEAYRVVKSLYRDADFDVIASPLKSSTIAPALIAQRTSTPYALFVEGLLSQNIRNIDPFPMAGLVSDGITMLNALISDKTIVAFDRIQRWLTSFPFVDEGSIQTINHGVDSNRFYPEDKKTARQSLGIPHQPERLTVGYVGSFKNRHRLDLLIDGINELRKDGYPIQAVLVGDGELRDEIEEKISSLGLDDIFTLPGYVSDSEISLYVAACDVLYGVRDESHWSNPLKVYEYLACDRPAIAFRTPHTSFIEDHDFGIVVDSTNTSSIKESIKTAHERIIVSGSGFNNGREYIVDNFNWGNHADAVVSVARK